MTILDKIKNTVDNNGLLSNNDSVLIGLSGGPDSVALLYLLIELKRKYNLSLSAVYINHGSRPKAAKREEAFCQEICNNSQIELFIISENIQALSKKMKKGFEETARDFRYGVFQKLSEEYNFSKIAIGHHMNDQVETVLFRIFRGTGISGLTGIKTKRDNIIRPLLNISKKEILDFLKSRNISYCTDRSNKNVEYKRNFIRNKLLPYLRNNLNPQIDKAIINLAENSKEEEAFLNSITQKEIKKTVSKTAGGKFELDVEKLKSYDFWIRRRILRYCMSELSGDKLMPDKDVIDRLLIKSESKAALFSLPDSIYAKTVGNKFVLFSKNKINISAKLNIGKKCEIEQLHSKISIRKKNIKEINLLKKRRSFKVQLDYSQIKAPLVIRSIKNGDRFSPLGLKGTKKIGDYLTDCKVDSIYRDEIPVITDFEGIIWLVGFEIDQRVKIKKLTKEVLEIELSRSKKYRP